MGADTSALGEPRAPADARAGSYAVEGPRLDLLVIGSGVAGLSAVLRADGAGMRTGLVTKGDLDDATTRWAQGGVAAALGAESGAVDAHLEDTLAVGAGLCDPAAARVLVEEGPTRVEELIALGARFDRDQQGRLELAREGGHSVPRVLHAGGAATGEEIERALVAAVGATAATIHTRTFLEDLVIIDGVCRGAWCRLPDGSRMRVLARNVLVAAGGAGQLYSVTTNPAGSTGDGIAAAIRAGAVVADIEFFQFHPTALRHQRSPRPLLTEALRGHGAVLRNRAGERFVDELLPRDVVSRAILEQMTADGTDHVMLDARGLESFERRFPTIAEVLASVGLDPARDLLPVHPAAHHLCGGVLTDLHGATTVEGLWACGEVACTGVHGANRLASNSLLEGMVFAPRAVRAMAEGHRVAEPSGALGGLVGSGSPGGPDGPDCVPVEVRGVGGSPAEACGAHAYDPPPCNSSTDSTVASLLERLQAAMMAGAGVRRSAASLGEVHDELAFVAGALGSVRRTGGEGSGGGEIWVAELVNLLTLAGELVTSARARTESRGTHWRDDHPHTDPSQRVRYGLSALAGNTGIPDERGASPHGPH